MVIVIDAVFFQLHKTGIARLWTSLLEEWSKSSLAKHLVIIDRAGTAPKISGIKFRLVPLYNYSSTEADREMLQQVCDEEGADLFISTYYTTPLSIPSVFMAYDMIPEVLGWDMNNPMWQEKHRAIQQASAYIAISENTARDLVRFFPDISPELVRVAPCGVKSSFFPANLEEVNSFRTKYGISKPYFILVVTGGGHKNTNLFFQAFAQLYSKQGFDIVCTGNRPLLAPELRAYSSGSVVHMLQLSDEELRLAYSGAVSLVYPSKHEGFGLPILEAMACGCPVITCPNASIPEVAGKAALYVNDTDINGLANALCEVHKPDVRNSLIAAGLEQAKKFLWVKMAEIVSSTLVDATLLHLNLRDINLIIFPDWSQPDESLGIELEQVIKTLATHADKNYITLLIDTSNTSEENANLFLSGVAMNLLMQEDLDVTEGAEISLVGHLDEMQWESLLPRLYARIILENENREAITKAKAETLQFYQLHRFRERSLPHDLIRIPNSLIKDYLKYLLSPRDFQEPGEAELYYHYIARLVLDIHTNIVNNPKSQRWQEIAKYFTSIVNFIPLYFNQVNLKSIYKKRADILEANLKNQYNLLEFEFSRECSPEQNKIRLGILASHYGIQTETFATLPIYKHLNRDLFEIILFTINTTNHRLERYCAGHADVLVKLPADLPNQVEAIRKANLDILFISTNVTAVTHQITLLAMHRLARIQMVDANSPVTTGMPHVDYYISSQLSEPENDAQQHYTETLVKLDGPPQCFDFATEAQSLPTTSISRESLGINKEAVVYISGANYYKIIPEIEEVWARIIASVPNSILLLYPFNPNWSSSYPVIAFRKRITVTLAKHGISEDRLFILDSAPNRADVKERLKLSDIYLDSYPYSGMTSLIEPLEVGLPMVVWEGEYSRSKKGASLLRSLDIQDLITSGEEAYTQLAVALGTNPELRQRKSELIKQKMQTTPPFLDSRAYSTKMGALFQNLFRKYLADALSNNLRLKDINLIIFPDWSQPEELITQDLGNVVRGIATHPDKRHITLLVNTCNISEEDADLALSSVVMNLLMEENLELEEELEISILGKLSDMQWKALLTRLQSRIILENENQESIAQAKAEKIPAWELSSLSEKRAVQQETGNWRLQTQ